MKSLEHPDYKNRVLQLSQLDWTAVKTNDAVSITLGHKTVEGRIRLASTNERSLMLEFDDGTLWTSDGSMYLGMMPVLRDDQGVYRDLVHNEPVTIKVKESNV